MADSRYLLEVKDLSKVYPSGAGRHRHDVRAVDGISFSIRPAETFGLVGESGCGKTTTGRMLIRLENSSAGSIFLGGRDISGPMNRELARYISQNCAMIFQDPIESLNPRMTVEEIVGEGLRLRGVSRARVHEAVLEALSSVGLSEEHATRYPHEFSGGQRQRIGIARAIILRPRLIIADEPVSALDVSIQAQIINLLNDLKEKMGLTILFIAHNLSVVKYFSDRIGVMYYGKLVEIAPSAALYARPMHPYTRALLSAIPQPNPLTERTRRRIDYDPGRDHDYTRESPALREIEPGHFVLCSPSEEADLRAGR